MGTNGAGTGSNAKQSALAFFQSEAAGGILMMIAAAAALVISNSAWAPFYQWLLDVPVSVRIGELALDKPLLHWINDGLMAVFFCLVALEIKREIVAGELSTREQASLPALAALGGMAMPALIYWALNQGDQTALRGWAIPTATDIAFAVTVLSLIGRGVPPALKVFLLALAIIDDLGAIVIIALFYTAKLSGLALALAAVGVAILVLLNLRGTRVIAAYVVTGVFVWICVLKSGIHATLAGVLLGLAIPLRTDDAGSEGSPLLRLEGMLHPWVAFGVLPLFGFANAGVSLAGLSLASLAHPVTLGIALGLVIGKPVGIVLACWLADRSRLSALPNDTTWQQLIGASMLAGIGFTMSLFIGILAFDEAAFATPVRVGVLAGSLVSAIAGYIVLTRAAPSASPAKESTP
ncbi:MAG: Na+/H+ antiporter NhaA [Hyphomicrobiaceae bacterium]|nr:Na+/H+ antiporter NhaA [Hyphomicrobiaceae bacterium]